MKAVSFLCKSVWFPEAEGLSVFSHPRLVRSLHDPDQMHELLYVFQCPDVLQDRNFYAAFSVSRDTPKFGKYLFFVGLKFRWEKKREKIREFKKIFFLEIPFFSGECI